MLSKGSANSAKPRMNVQERINAYFAGPAFTLWTFIKYHERSKDPAHCKRLRDRMRERLNRLMAEGKAHRTRSLRGKIAYRRGMP